MTRILLVEPDEGSAGQLSGALSQHEGWEVTRVGTVLEAIREAGEKPFDAAVLDYELPDGSGMDIMDFLRIGSPGIRIVVVANRKSEEVAFHALSHGAGDFMIKDKHLALELPRRIDALLHEGVNAHAALVETLLPHDYDEAKFEETRSPEEQENALQTTVRELVG